MKFIKKHDKEIATIFALLTLIFIVFSMTNDNFFNWVYERHQNQLSWFIRPIFLIPFCFFAYMRSWTGISVTVFCLLTSMFWFDKPDTVSIEVEKFLNFEKEWLYEDWNFNKILLILTVPISLSALALAFWNRSLWMGLGVIILIASGKIVWSIHNAGDSGKSIILPAITGLIICCALIYFGFRKLEKRD